MECWLADSTNYQQHQHQQQQQQQQQQAIAGQPPTKKGQVKTLYHCK